MFNAYEVARSCHSLVHIIAVPGEELSQVASNAISVLAHRLGPSFLIFVPMLLKALMDSHNMPVGKLVGLLSRLLVGELPPQIEHALKIKLGMSRECMRVTMHGLRGLLIWQPNSSRNHLQSLYGPI